MGSTTSMWHADRSPNIPLSSALVRTQPKSPATTLRGFSNGVRRPRIPQVARFGRRRHPVSRVRTERRYVPLNAVKCRTGEWGWHIDGPADQPSQRLAVWRHRREPLTGSDKTPAHNSVLSPCFFPPWPHLLTKTLEDGLERLLSFASLPVTRSVAHGPSVPLVSLSLVSR